MSGPFLFQNPLHEDTKGTKKGQKLFSHGSNLINF